jgi:hypothetical protein
MTTDPTGRGSRAQMCCDLCGSDLTIANAVGDDLWTFAICAGCTELWTTYLMHNPTSRLSHPGEGRDAGDYRSKSAG